MWTFSFDRDYEPGKTQDEYLKTSPGLDMIEFSHSLDGQYRPFHTHDEFHLLFCVGGNGFLRFSNSEISLTPGTMALIRPGILHSCGARKDYLEFWGLSFYSTGPNDAVSRELLSSNIQSASFFEHLEYIRSAFKYLSEICDRALSDPSIIPFIRMQTYLLLHFSCLMFGDNPLERLVLEDMPMQDVMHWIIDNYKEDITLEILARRFAMSSSHLSRCFFQSFQVSPINYLIDYRLNMAKDLLFFTDKTIHDIAEDVGYSNVYHFSNLFTKRIGLTPQQYRDYCRKNNPDRHTKLT